MKSTQETRIVAAQKASAAKSDYAKYIEVRGADQFRVRFRGKKFGGTKNRGTYDTLPEAESACIAFLKSASDLGLDWIQKQHAERKRAQKVTFGDLIRARMHEIGSDPKKGDTHSHYGMLRGILRNDGLCEAPLPILAPFHFEQYIEDRLDEGVKSSTVRREIGMLAGIISTAMNREYRNTFEFNPASQKAIDYPDDSEHLTRRLAADEEAKIRSALKDLTKGRYIEVMFEIALALGMRQGEIRQMEWRDVNFEKKYIYIPRTKTNRPRSVPLLDDVAASLTEWKARNEKLAKRYGIELPGWIFWSKDNGVVQAITKNAVRIMWRKVCQRAGIDLPPIQVSRKVRNSETGRTKTEWINKANPDNLHFHDLRHEATSRLFENHGLSIVEVMAVTGHRTTTMIERYTHLHAQEIGKKLNQSGATLDMPISQEMGSFLQAESSRLGVPEEEVVTLLIQQAMRERKPA